MRPTEARKLQRRIEQERERIKNPPPVVDQQRPSVFRLLMMVLWAKITGAGR
jgi:hypothetical protein